MLCFHHTKAYYNDQFEQIEQKYESSNEGDGQDFLSSPETLNQAYSELEPAQVQQSYGSTHVGGSISQSLLSNSNYDGSAGSELKSLEGRSSEYSKVTQIPSGTLFSMGEKGTGALEFQSPFSKEPYSIVFRTHSMPVKIKQQHQTLPAPEVEFVRSQEEAHRIKHEVVRPVIQEVHEIIQPYRRVVQEVRPVIENVHTIVSKGEGRGGAQDGRGGIATNAGPGLGGNLRSFNGEGLNVGYSQNMPLYVSPAQQYKIKSNLGQMQFAIQSQYNTLSRGNSAHY